MPRISSELSITLVQSASHCVPFSKLWADWACLSRHSLLVSICHHFDFGIERCQWAVQYTHCVRIGTICSASLSASLPFSGSTPLSLATMQSCPKRKSSRASLSSGFEHCCTQNVSGSPIWIWAIGRTIGKTTRARKSQVSSHSRPSQSCGQSVGFTRVTRSFPHAVPQSIAQSLVFHCLRTVRLHRLWVHPHNWRCRRRYDKLALSHRLPVPIIPVHYMTQFRPWRSAYRHRYSLPPHNPLHSSLDSLQIHRSHCRRGAGCRLRHRSWRPR